MKWPAIRTLSIGLAALLPLAGIAQEKPALDHDAYGVWRAIDGEQLSPDGRWLLYELSVEEGDSEVVVRSVEGETEYRIERASDARFTGGGGWVVGLRKPPYAEVRRARLDKVDKEDLPKPELILLDLSTGDKTVIERVAGFELSTESGDVVAFLREPEPATGEETDADSASESDGRPLHVRVLSSGTEIEQPHVVSHGLSADGRHFVAFVDAGEDPGSTALIGRTDTGEVLPLDVARGDFERPVFSKDGSLLAFLWRAAAAAEDDGDAPTQTGDGAAATGEAAPGWALQLWTEGGGLTAVAAAGTSGLADGWQPSEHRAPTFSPDGSRLFFGSAPVPDEAPEPELLDEERINVDIWHWRDPLLQPQQLLQLERERERNYLAVALLDDGNRVVQLADEDLPEIDLTDDGEGAYGHGRSNLPYRTQSSWEFPGLADHFRVEIASGSRQQLARGLQGPLHLAPDGSAIVWWDNRELAWYGRQLDGENGAATRVDIPRPVHNEWHDWPYRPTPYGLAGWLRGSDGTARAVLYDRYDLWAALPGGSDPAVALTAGAGRDATARLRWIDLDPDASWMGDTLLLSALEEPTRDAGFWTVTAETAASPQVLIQGPHDFGRPVRARDADRLLFTRESIAEFPDLWVASPTFDDARRLTDANPQQAQFNWATVELTHWLSNDGEPLDGLIYKPENFDPERQYPMMVSFYERSSETLNSHQPPRPHRSVIRPTFYASRGYVVFVPDITYEIGYPGESALDDVIPGIQHVLARGYVDPQRIGVQGHSWGGYQIAYMITRSDIFAAAAGGAPVSNMVSAYGGIRWGSGMSRMFQYERTQSRLGGSLWEAPLRYIENSPIFWADKIKTPLMMLHNDHDGAVPWYQGIELFTALRRLDKPAWLINYNGEPHWPLPFRKRVDWNIRMQQFFDHYLKDAPAPRWLSEGIPAIEKGRTMGYEPVRQP